MRGQLFFYLETANDEVICRKSWLMFSRFTLCNSLKWTCFVWVDAFGRNPIETEIPSGVYFCGKSQIVIQCMEVCGSRLS